MQSVLYNFHFVFRPTCRHRRRRSDQHYYFHHYYSHVLCHMSLGMTVLYMYLYLSATHKCKTDMGGRTDRLSDSKCRPSLRCAANKMETDHWYWFWLDTSVYYNKKWTVKYFVAYISVFLLIYFFLSALYHHPHICSTYSNQLLTASISNINLSFRLVRLSKATHDERRDPASRCASIWYACTADSRPRDSPDRRCL